MKEELNFVILGKVKDIHVFNDVVALLDNLPDVSFRFRRTAKYWFYVTNDHKAAARAGLLRKNKRGPE